MLVFPWHQQHVCRLFFPRADCRIELGILCSFQNAVPDFRTFLPIFSVQNKFSVYDKAASKPLPETVLGSCEKGMLEYCLQEGIHFFPYGALGGLTARRGGRKMNAKVAEKAREKNVSPVSAAPRHGFSDFRSLWTFGKVPSAANTVPPTLHTHTHTANTHTHTNILPSSADFSGAASFAARVLPSAVAVYITHHRLPHAAAHGRRDPGFVRPGQATRGRARRNRSRSKTVNMFHALVFQCTREVRECVGVLHAAVTAAELCFLTGMWLRTHVEFFCRMGFGIGQHGSGAHYEFGDLGTCISLVTGSPIGVQCGESERSREQYYYGEWNRACTVTAM